MWCHKGHRHLADRPLEGHREQEAPTTSKVARFKRSQKQFHLLPTYLSEHQHVAHNSPGPSAPAPTQLAALMPQTAALTGLQHCSGLRPQSRQSARWHSWQFWNWSKTITLEWLVYFACLFSQGSTGPWVKNCFLLPFFMETEDSIRGNDTIVYFPVYAENIFNPSLADVLLNSKFGGVLFGDGVEQNQKQLWNRNWV